MSVSVTSTSSDAAFFPAFTLCPLYEEAYRGQFLQRYGMDRREIRQFILRTYAAFPYVVI